MVDASQGAKTCQDLSQPIKSLRGLLGLWRVRQIKLGRYAGPDPAPRSAWTPPGQGCARTVGMLRHRVLDFGEAYSYVLVQSRLRTIEWCTRSLHYLGTTQGQASPSLPWQNAADREADRAK